MLPPELVARLTDCVKHDFVSARDHWFSCLKWSTTVVAAGLVIELPELLYELTDIARQRIPRLKYKIVLLERHLQIFKAVAFFGWFLIVAGVVGERVAEVRVSDFDASIQDCSAAKVEEATLEAGDAKDSALFARKQADDLLAKYVKAEQEIAELKAKTLPRRLSSQQKALLVKRVAAFKTKTIFVDCVNGSGNETLDFEQDFIAAFKSSPSLGSGVKNFVGCSQPAGRTHTPSIRIEFAPDRQDDAKVLIDALADIGINKNEITAKPNNFKALLLLIIGPR